MATTSDEITRLNKPQIKNILKIKFLRDDVKKNITHTSKEYTEMVNEYFNERVPEDKNNPGYETAFKTLTNEVMDIARNVLKIKMIETKFADEYAKAYPKAEYAICPTWPTDAESARIAMTKLCNSDILKKHKAVYDFLNHVYTEEVAAIKEQRKKKITATREKNKTPEGKQAQLEKLEKDIQRKNKRMDDLKKVVAKTSSASSKSKIKVEEVSEEEDGSEVEGSEVEGSEAEVSETE